MANSKMAEHLGSMYFVFLWKLLDKNIRQIRQIGQLIRNFGKSQMTRIVCLSIVCNEKVAKT